MMIVLNKKDIEALLKKEYNGIKTIDFSPDELDIKLEIDQDVFFKKTNIIKQPPVISAPALTPKPKNVMAQAGIERKMGQVF